MTVPSSGRVMVRMPRAHFHSLMASLPARAFFGTGAIRPLFRSAYAAGLTTQHDQPVSQQTEWLLSHGEATERHPWDVAHDMVRGKTKGATQFATGPDVYAEPDLLQPSPVPPAKIRKAAVARVRSAAPVTGPPYRPGDLLIDYYPPAGDKFSPAWHLQKEFANFAGAWKTTTGAGVRIAHLDTGYTKGQDSTPRNFLSAEGTNITDGTSDLTDIDTGEPWNMAGHGTATLALLAGNKVNLQYDATGPVYNGDIGGAPDASIVPVVISRSVIHLYTANVAEGLKYALSAPGGPCQVVSLSHGGLPSTTWAAAVNALYEAGVVVVAASGDSYSATVADIATHFTVYPSAFYRVVTATGVMFDNTPYTSHHLGALQGCWGPDAVMKKALAAYTPNVAWMSFKSAHGWDMDGGGTSASTPQIAAACALWLSKYGDQFPAGWTRVAACRHALFESAKDRGKDLTHIGVGTLDANEMLSQATLAKVQAAYKSQKLPFIQPDKVTSPFIRVLFGLPPPGPGVDEMYDTEAAQILFRSRNKDLVAAFQDDPFGKKKLPPKKAKALRDAMIREPAISETLKNYLKGASKAIK